MGAEGQPRLPRGPSVDFLSWMQGWRESFLSSQGRAWRLSAGTEDFALSRLTALRANSLSKRMLLPSLLRCTWQALQGAGMC